MSLHGKSVFGYFAGGAVLAGLGMLAALPASAQYPGQVTKTSKDNPELRAIAVLEWTGEAGKPKASRLVPVTVLDGGQLQDGGIYMARPEPLALAGEVEYELQQNGKAVGLFDIRNSGLEQGSWVGYGSWKAMPVARPKPAAEDLAKIKIDDEESDQPVLHRKKHPGDEPSGAGKDSDAGSSGTASSGPAPASDPDRPTLHKKDPDSSTGDASSSPAPSSAADPERPTLHKKTSDDSAGDANPSPASAPSTDDPDRPTLHKKSTSDSTGSDSGTSTASDPDRPTLKKSKKKQPEDIGHVDSLPSVTDPDRPLLKRGKSSGNGLAVVPTLMGMPPDMQQTVAVSDVKTRQEHPWSYTWANPEDEDKMKSAMEEMARQALGLAPPPAAAQPAPKFSRKNAKLAPPPPPPPPAPLMDEQFRVFELAYGSGATLVLSAHTDAPLAQRKFVTLVAQPDLYGNVLVLLKSVSDGAHLDDVPRMRLVDAVDALADNRGELLFELRGATQRQFALYRVLRGQAEKLFVSGGGEFGTEGRE
jgi:hypothetical protein